MKSLQSGLAGVPMGAGNAPEFCLAQLARADHSPANHRPASLEDAQITRTDNVSIRPQTIEQPPTTSASGSSFGIGVGGGSFSGGRGGGVGVGTGVGVSIPVGSDTRVAGNTVLYFPLDQVGQAPWRLTVRVAGATLDIVLLPR